jgi:hypothetical protein
VFCVWCPGSQGWGDASNPAFTPVLYSPYATVGFRFTTLTPGTIPRMYHSTANLLPVSFSFCKLLPVMTLQTILAGVFSGSNSWYDYSKIAMVLRRMEIKEGWIIFSCLVLHWFGSSCCTLEPSV